MDYVINGTDQVIHINDENLIKPEDITNHIGEVVMLHNGLGYVVSGILASAEPDIDEYSFASKCKELEYTHELVMDMFYFPDHADAIYCTFDSARYISVHNIVYDEQMGNIRYIAKATDEEKAFRDKILSYSKEWFERNFDSIENMSYKYNDIASEKDSKSGNTEFDWDWDLLMPDDKEKINKILNEK